MPTGDNQVKIIHFFPPNNVQHRIKKSMEHKLEKYNMSYSKYTNWPSCDSTDWMTRYWGENYNRLLAIKAYWDPHNIFNHCQSVGSTDNMCCPFTLRRPQG